MTASQAIIVMGPSGCGKSTVGQALSAKTAWPLVEGDDFHPPASIAKLTAGAALTDPDRAAWIDELVSVMDSLSAPTIVAACSALTPYVQRRLVDESCRDIRFVMLELSRETLAERVKTRTDHFMHPELIDSQIAALTVPDGALILHANKPVADLVDTIIGKLAE